MTGVEIEFVAEKVPLDASEPSYSEFASIFAHFQFPEEGEVQSSFLVILFPLLTSLSLSLPLFLFPHMIGRCPPG